MSGGDDAAALTALRNAKGMDQAFSAAVKRSGAAAVTDDEAVRQLLEEARRSYASALLAAPETAVRKDVGGRLWALHHGHCDALQKACRERRREAAGAPPGAPPPPPQQQRPFPTRTPPPGPGGPPPQQYGR